MADYCSPDPDVDNYCGSSSIFQTLTSYLLKIIMAPVMPYIGTLYAIKVALQLTMMAYMGIKVYVLAFIFKQDLQKKYGEYVVITNTADIIGKEFARAFAALGHSIVLIGENSEEFTITQKEVQSQLKEKRSLKVIIKDEKWNDEKIYQLINNEMAEIKSEVGILVNNASLQLSCHGKFLKYTDEKVLSVVHSNIVDILMVTKAVLPIMVENKRGLIINITTSCNFRPIERCGFPSTIKDFVDSFGIIIGNEYRKHNIDMQIFNPGWIREEHPNTWFPSFFVPTGEKYAKMAIASIGRKGQISGFWGHSLLNRIMDIVPSRFHGFMYFIYRKCSGSDKNLSMTERMLEIVRLIKDFVMK